MNKYLEKKHWIILLIFGLIPFLALIMFLLNLLTSPDGQFSFYKFIRDLVVSFPFTILVTLIDYYLIRKLNSINYLSKHSVLRFTTEIIFVALFAIIIVALGNFVFIRNWEVFINYLTAPSFIVSAIASTIVNFFIIIVIEFLVQIERNQELRRANLEMEYQQLKEQINPHFLFNSLNGLVSLINKDSAQAVNYTQKLSEVYRYVLFQDSKKLIYVEDEVKFIETYINILRIRYGEGLISKISISDEALQSLIPPMSLQLLVENAVKHNAISLKKPLYITIESEDEYLVIKNNIAPRSGVVPSTGIGLDNLNKKYQIMSPDDIILDKTHEEFIVKLPLL